ncbi:hypothetical protein FRC10_004066 [Ceratobasidium sp. 414]|nr:hypothetical protein FRC10_004066 [Ceratobasidium sp. 414]
MCTEVLVPALDAVEREWRSVWRSTKRNKAGVKEGAEGGFVITGTGDKFFSNVPTVAALNGHTFAAGYLLALACDYRVMTSGKAWASFNEVHFGAPFPPAFAALIRVKLGHAHPTLMRRTVLEGHRFTPPELLTAGAVDAIVDGKLEYIPGLYLKVLERACAIATTMGANARGGAWGLIKKGIYKEALDACRDDSRQVMPDEEDVFARARL